MRFKLIALIAVLFLLPNVAFGAIAFDASSTGKSAAGQTTFSWTHVTTTTANRGMSCGISTENVLDRVINVSYAGVSTTLVKSQGGNGEFAYMFRLVAPASGSNTVRVDSASTTTFRVACETLVGVAQTGQPDASSTVTVLNNIAATTTLTTVADNAWTVSYAQSNGNSTIKTTGHTNITFRAQVADAFNAIGDSNGPITPASTVSQTYVANAATYWNMLTMSWAPAAATTPSVAPTMKVIFFDD